MGRFAEKKIQPPHPPAPSPASPLNPSPRGGGEAGGVRGRGCFVYNSDIFPPFSLRFSEPTPMLLSNMRILRAFFIII